MGGRVQYASFRIYLLVPTKAYLVLAEMIFWKKQERSLELPEKEGQGEWTMLLGHSILLLYSFAQHGLIHPKSWYYVWVCDWSYQTCIWLFLYTSRWRGLNQSFLASEEQDSAPNFWCLINWSQSGNSFTIWKWTKGSLEQETRIWRQDLLDPKGGLRESRKGFWKWNHSCSLGVWVWILIILGLSRFRQVDPLQLQSSNPVWGWWDTVSNKPKTRVKKKWEIADDWS